jgi:hypothetical protein
VDLWDSAASTNLILASGFFSSKAFHKPTHPRVTQTVGQQNMKKIQSITPKSIDELRSVVDSWRLKYSNSSRTFFRGQSNRYTGPDGNDWIFPSICRDNRGWVTKLELDQRLKILKKRVKKMAEKYLDSDAWSTDTEIRRILSDMYLCHGLCQHYNLCATPHLDVTEDFEIAYAFAKHKDMDKGFLFLIRTPRCPHLINVFFEENLYAINLQKIALLQTERPRVQQAWSLSFYPEISTLTKELYGPQAFNLRKYVDIIIDLKHIIYEPKHSYHDLMVKDEFYKIVA